MRLLGRKRLSIVELENDDFSIVEILELIGSDIDLIVVELLNDHSFIISTTYSCIWWKKDRGIKTSP